jgi:hypothetical protein
MSEVTAEEIQVSIDEAKEAVELRDHMQRLMKNADFKAVVLEAYFKDEPARLVELKAAHAMQAEEYQRAIVKDMDAIGGFQQFINRVFHFGREADEMISQGEATLGEMAEEGEI